MQVPPADANKDKPKTIKGKQYSTPSGPDTSHLPVRAKA